MRHHQIGQGPGQTLCPRCGRPRLLFQRDEPAGDVYRCEACGLEVWHLVGRHFHGVWSWAVRERMGPCLGYQMQPVGLTPQRKISTVLRTPPRCRRHPEFRPACEHCRILLSRLLGEEVSRILAERLQGEEVVVRATSEVLRMFGVERSG